MATIIGIISMIFASRWVKALILVVKQILTSLPPDLASETIALIREAAVNPTLTTNAERFAFVFNALRAKYPDLPTNALNIAIETIYATWQQSRS